MTAPLPPKSETPQPQTPPPPKTGVEQEINWADYRDHLATADKDGRRRWIYPKKPHGRFYNARTYVSWLLLAIMFAGPFIRIQGNPLLMINIIERKFSILGQIFWPEDTIIFAVAMLLFLTSIIIFTTAFGRLWCGWTCPQTLLMEMVFRKIEYAIEGDGPQQKALNAAPWTASKITKKALKHSLFFALSFLIGNTLLSYIIGSDALLKIITDPPNAHLHGLAFMILFTLIFYAIFARFREQACTFICPYGRFQSAILDENTLVVAYDHRRGEKRGPLNKLNLASDRSSSGLGDCVDCRQCVAVCPTGIDIRNGTQMECVNCTACIDACDAIMTKIHRPLGLIRYASLNAIEQGQSFRFTPRLAGYTAVLAALAIALGALVWTRSDVETLLLRAPGALFQNVANGQIQNIYTLKLVNKTARELPIELKLENVPGTLKIMSGGVLTVPRQELAQSSVLIQLDPAHLKGANTPIRIGVYSKGRLIETIKTVFVGPRP